MRTRTRPSSHDVIVVRHAHLNSGRPLRCTPSRAEVEGGPRREHAGSDHKIVYPSQEAAEAAAAELAELDGGARCSYRCGRSRADRPGHYHLTHDRHAGVRGGARGGGVRLAYPCRRARHGRYPLADAIPAARWELLRRQLQPGRCGEGISPAL